MRTVMIPVDGSDNALRAAKFALELASDFKHPLNFEVVCAVPPPGAWQLLPFQSGEELEQRFHQEGQQLVASVVALMEAANAEHFVHLVKGDPAGNIARLVAEQRCDAVVMGTQGTGSVRDRLLGSVVSKVIRLVDVPVILVK